MYPTPDQETQQALIQSGICPDCGGSLDMPHVPRNPFAVSVRGGGYRERQCYNCHEVFMLIPDES